MHNPSAFLTSFESITTKATTFIVVISVYDLALSSFTIVFIFSSFSLSIESYLPNKFVCHTNEYEHEHVNRDSNRLILKT